MTDKTASVHGKARAKGLGGIRDGCAEGPYGFASRFEDDRRGPTRTGRGRACFTTAFSFACARGLATRDVDTRATCAWSSGTRASSPIALTMQATVPGIVKRRSRRSRVPRSVIARCQRRWRAFRKSRSRRRCGRSSRRITSRRGAAISGGRRFGIRRRSRQARRSAKLPAQ